jgi:hypothetical protein
MIGDADKTDEYNRNATTARDEQARRANGDMSQTMTAAPETTAAMKNFSSVQGAENIPKYILEGTWRGTISEGQLKELAKVYNIPDSKFDEFKKVIDADPNITVVAGNAAPVNTGHNFTANVTVQQHGTRLNLADPQTRQASQSSSQTAEPAPAPATGQLTTVEMDRFMDKLKSEHGNKLSVQLAEQFAADQNVPVDDVYLAVISRDPGVELTQGNGPDAADAVYGSASPQQTASAAATTTAPQGPGPSTPQNNRGMGI